MNRFRMFVPEGWQLIDLTQDIEPQVALAAQRLVLGIPTSLASKTAGMINKVTSGNLRKLKDSGALAFLLPIDALVANGVHPTLLVQRFTPPEGVGPLEALVGIAATEAGATLLDATDLVGLRVESTDSTTIDPSDLNAMTRALGATSAGEAAEALGPVQRVARRVRYVLGRPTDDLGWVEILGSVQLPESPESDAVASAILALFDELARSFHWEEVGP